MSRRWNIAPYAEWITRLSGNADPVEASEELTAENRMAEDIYLGLRTSRGLVLFDAETARTEAWVDAGWAKRCIDNRIVLTPHGWLRLDALATDLTHVRSCY